MNVEIVKYSPGLYKKLYTLLKETYNSNISKYVLEKNYISSDKYIFLAMSGEKLLGCAFLEIKQDYIRPYKYGYVSYVAVDTQYRKQGIGKSLIGFLILFAKKNGCSAIELTSANERTNAHIFYESLGFTKKKTTVFIKEPL